MVTGTLGTRQLEEPFSIRAEASTGFDDGGYVVKISGSGATVSKTDGITDTPFGVVMDDTKDATTLEVQNGKLVSVQRHGIVPVKSAAVTWRRGDTAYLHTTDGYVTNVDGGSAKKIGLYVGQDNVAAAAGDKVEIDLDASVSDL